MGIVVRATVVYWFLWLIVRGTGKRSLAELTPLDMVLIVVLGDLVQQGITQEDMSVRSGRRRLCLRHLDTVLRRHLTALPGGGDMAERTTRGGPTVGTSPGGPAGIGTTHRGRVEGSGTDPRLPRPLATGMGHPRDRRPVQFRPEVGIVLNSTQDSTTAPRTRGNRMGRWVWQVSLEL